LRIINAASAWLIVANGLAFIRSTKEAACVDLRVK
jgi:hypothetical protein